MHAEEFASPFEVAASVRFGNTLAARLREPSDGFRYPHAVRFTALSVRRGGGFLQATALAMKLCDDKRQTEQDAKAFVGKLIREAKAERDSEELPRYSTLRWMK